jgi:hypothetical protein
MCDQCTNHNTLIDLLFTYVGHTSAQQRNVPVSLAAMMMTESAAADRGRTPQELAQSESAARILKTTTPEQRNEALHFLAMLKRITTMAGNTLALAKHIYRDSDAEERAPGFAPMAEKLMAEKLMAESENDSSSSNPLAAIFGKPPAPPRGNPRWN